MPKVTNTRRQRAFELLRMMRDGPSIGMPTQMLRPRDVEEAYRIWVRSWILYEIIQLVPELRQLHKKNKIDIDGDLTIFPSEQINKHNKKGN